MNQPTFTFRVGKTTFAAGASETERHAAIETANTRQRLAGLPDTLNPELIDPAKADALVKAVAALPPEQIGQFAGKTLYLNSPGLLLGVAAPTRAEAFAALTTIDVADTQGDLVLLKASPEIDCALAAKLAGDARAAVASINEEAAGLEKIAAKNSSDGGQAQDAVSNAHFRRSAAARVWSLNALAAHRCAPANAAARDDAELAKSQAHAYATPPWAGGLGQ